MLFTTQRLLVAACVAPILVACGGGGGSSPSTPTVDNPTPPAETKATGFKEVTFKSRDDADGPHLILMPGGSATDVVDVKAVPNVANRGCTWSSTFSGAVFDSPGSCETTVTISGDSPAGEGMLVVTLDDNTDVTESYPIYVNTAQETYAVRNGIREEEGALNVFTSFILGENAGNADECGGFTLAQFDKAITGFKTEAEGGINGCQVVYDYQPTDDAEPFGVVKTTSGEGLVSSDGFASALYGDRVLTRNTIEILKEPVEFNGPNDTTVFLGGTVARDRMATSELRDQAGVEANNRYVFVQVHDLTSNSVTFRSPFQDLTSEYGIYHDTWTIDSDGSWEHTSRDFPADVSGIPAETVAP